MAEFSQPKIKLCPECQARFEGYQKSIASGDISKVEALRNAVRDCDTNDYRYFYPFGFSKHGVIFVAEEEATRQKAKRRAQKAREGT